MFSASLDVEITEEIERPCDELWAFVSNPERQPVWADEL
jgi:hypothetical protein